METPITPRSAPPTKPNLKQTQVPTLSLKDYFSDQEDRRRHFMNDLFVGLKDYGFIILKDHPIDSDLLRQAYHLSESLFRLPEETKRSFISPDGTFQRGYTPFGQEHAKDSPVPDLKEFWHIGRDLDPTHPLYKTYPLNIWPDSLPDFQKVFTRMYKELDDTGRILLEALTEALGVERDYFTKMTAYGSSILRLLHYPPIPQSADPRSIRAAAHEDINLITLLVSASASGLELLTKDGRWLPVETEPDNIIVDAGDMLARITNDVIPSTTHRVVNPDDENRSRYSMPFFMHPNPDALLTCLPSCRGPKAKYPDILADEFLMERLKDIGLKAK